MLDPMKKKLALLLLLALFWVISFHVVEARSRGSSGSRSKGYGFTNSRSAQVKSTVTKTGQYRSAHTRTTPNSTDKDNYSTTGNTNPSTGKAGTKSSKSPF